VFHHRSIQNLKFILFSTLTNSIDVVLEKISYLAIQCICFTFMTEAVHASSYSQAPVIGLYPESAVKIYIPAS
jgi:hypothetical protein